MMRVSEREVREKESVGVLSYTLTVSSGSSVTGREAHDKLCVWHSIERLNAHYDGCIIFINSVVSFGKTDLYNI